MKPAIELGQMSRVWLGIMLATLAMTWLLADACLERIHRVEKRVLDDSTAARMAREYQRAVPAGDPERLCLMAGAVAWSYRIAHDTANARQWRHIEARDCARRAQ